MKKYLAGDVRDRIRDLSHEQNKTYAELARIAGMDASSFSRFMSGKTSKLDCRAVRMLAREFRVSTDFLLGHINHPDRLHYDLADLRLSVEAGRKLFTGKINGEVISRLLEAPGAAVFFGQIEGYLSKELAAGIASRDTVYNRVAGFLLQSGDIPDAAKVQSLRDNAQNQLQNIELNLGKILNAIRKDNELEVMAKRLTAQEFDRVLVEVPRPPEKGKRSAAPEMIADAVLECFREQDLVCEETLNQFRLSLMKLLQESQTNAGETYDE